MNYQINEVSRKMQTIRLGIGLLLMSLASVYSHISVSFVIIYVLGIASFIREYMRKKERIVIDERIISCSKGDDIELTVNLSTVKRIHIKREGNWAIRKDSLIIETNEETCQRIISNFDINQIVSTFKMVSKTHDIEFINELEEVI
jgi:hypothetical protein